MAPETPSLFTWRPAAWLRVTGPDAPAFLQGQFTNDLRLLERQPAIYGLWLNTKGRVIADSFVMPGREKESYAVCSYFSPATVIRERLESFIIADDVQVTDETNEWYGSTESAESAVDFARGDQDVFIFPGRRGLEKSHVERMTRSLAPEASRTAMTAVDMERTRIRAGLPAVPVDIGPGELPNEGGLEQDAISYTKGCYLGQEVMARLRSMGQVRRRLVVVEGAVPPPAHGAPLFQNGKRVGEIRSTVSDGGGFVGFALLSLINLDPTAGLCLAADGAVSIHKAGAR